ncbi:MAG: phytanoyl-CoA dioxygenase family protein [Caldilineaceae bacterium]|nr:phytanoyl-CoA dioxygenase family protein [Caldilineaceae bacterium]MXZ20652.1 phytanoyl-CoA dioxygenase family protein [Caldilineaceae bacterium SB0665_bin_25]
MLTAEQIAHFETFGFVVRRRCFSSSEMEEISDAFDEVLTEDRQGKPFDGEQRQAVLGFIEKRPLLSALAEDDRIYGPLEQLLGPGFVWIGSDGNLYVGDTGWHPDGSVLDYGRIKVALYLDAVTEDTGCLRVIPGSHRLPLHAALDPLRQIRNSPDETAFGAAGRDIPCFPLESEPGDVVFFNQNLWHAAFGGRTGRRMFTLNFGAQPSRDKDIEFLKRVYQGNLKHVENMQYTQSARVYEDAFLYSDSPRIKGMVGKLVELGFK